MRTIYLIHKATHNAQRGAATTLLGRLERKSHMADMPVSHALDNLFLR